MIERWIDITGYEGFYAISDQGRVRNTRTGRVLVLHPDTCGYSSVKLNRAGVRHTFNVHRLVADAFIGPRTSEQQIAHLDGNMANARAENLRIVSRIENEFHKEIHGRGRRNLVWRKPSQSNPPHPADGMSQSVACGDGAHMSIIDPRSFDDGGPEWVMRYGDPSSVRYCVASLLSSYDYLLSDSITFEEARRRIKLLRRARAECQMPAVAQSDSSPARSGTDAPNPTHPSSETPS